MSDKDDASNELDDSLEKNEPSVEPDVSDGARSDQRVKNEETDERAKSHDPSSNKKKAVTAAVSIGVALAAVVGVLAFAALKDDGGSNEAGNISAPETVEPGGSFSDGSTSRGGSDEQGGSIDGGEADDLPDSDYDRPKTRTNYGKKIIGNHETKSSDEDVTNIFDLLNTALSESANTTSGDGGSEGEGDIGNIANFYFYGNDTIAANFVEGAHAGWTLSRDDVRVYEHSNPGVKKIAAVLRTADGEPAYVLEGYYDPVIDAIKPTAANQTEAGFTSLIG